MSLVQRGTSYRCLLLLQLLLGHYCYGQSCEEDSLFNNFRNDIQIEQGLHNDSIIWDRDTRISYVLLMSTVSIESLIKYTDDSIPAVRSAMFRGLIEKKAADNTLQEILIKHLNDSATYIDALTDAVTTWKVSEVMQLGFEYRKEFVPIDYKAFIENGRPWTAVTIPGARHGIVTKNILLNTDRLTCLIPGVRIVSFTTTIGNTVLNSSNLFTDQIKELISKMKPGDGIFFDDIKAEGPDKRIRNLGTLTFRIQPD